MRSNLLVAFSLSLALGACGQGPDRGQGPQRFDGAVGPDSVPVADHGGAWPDDRAAAPPADKGPQPATNSGKACVKNGDCPAGEDCILLAGWTAGYCAARCAKAGDACVSPAGQLSACLVSNSAETEWWCLYLCGYNGQSYACPAPGHQCAEVEPGLEVCQPQGTCTPDCTGKQCGGDGCGGSCGTCPTGKTCQAGACSGGTTGGDPAGVDRATCTGIASSSGTVAGATPKVSEGVVLTDSSSGGLKLVLMPAPLAAGALTIGLYFTPIAGQLSYPPTGATGCAVLKYTGSGWSVVDKTQMCDLSFSLIKHASGPGTCDGTLAGSFNGIFSANLPLAGTFYLPSDVAASQITQPSCLPKDAPCTSHSQCCSQSCWPALGLCH